MHFWIEGDLRRALMDTLSEMRDCNVPPAMCGEAKSDSASMVPLTAFSIPWNSKASPSGPWSMRGLQSCTHARMYGYRVNDGDIACNQLWTSLFSFLSNLFQL